jgi:hypothetical protein
MSWCDKLSSVPTVGARFTPKLFSADAIIETINPLLSRFADKRKLLFEVVRSSNNLTFNMPDGFNYFFDYNRINVGYAYRIDIEQTSGGLPRLDISNEVIPFEVAAAECARRLAEIVAIFPDTRERDLVATGVVSNTSVSVGDAPPGLRRLVEYFSQPWGTIDALAFQVVGLVEKTEKWRDRCSYQLAIAEAEEEKVPQFIFDWQRNFDPPTPIATGDIKRIIELSLERALGVFEQIGENGFVSNQ